MYTQSLLFMLFEKIVSWRFIFSYLSFGTCEPYLGVPSFCNGVLASDSYIFNYRNISQQEIARQLDDRINTEAIYSDSEECGDLVARLLCNYFFPSCGSREGGVHLPLSLCSRECNQVFSSCIRTIRLIQSFLSQTDGLDQINCANHSVEFGGLAACCTGLNITVTIPNTPDTGEPFLLKFPPPPPPPPQRDPSTCVLSISAFYLGRRPQNTCPYCAWYTQESSLLCHMFRVT